MESNISVFVPFAMWLAELVGAVKDDHVRNWHPYMIASLAALAVILASETTLPMSSRRTRGAAN